MESRRMKSSDVPGREPAPPPDRLSQLSEAILRINDTLDFDRVLQEVVDSATALTGATHGVITPLDESGRLEDYFTSGMTAAERVALVATPGSMQFFEYLSGLPEPLRVPDSHRHTRSLGLPEFRTVPVKAFLSAPIRHQREGVGNIYLARDEYGPEFGREDQESFKVSSACRAPPFSFLLLVHQPAPILTQRLVHNVRQNVVHPSPIGDSSIVAATTRLAETSRHSRLGDQWQLRKPHAAATGSPASAVSYKWLAGLCWPSASASMCTSHLPTPAVSPSAKIARCIAILETHH